LNVGTAGGQRPLLDQVGADGHIPEAHRHGRYRDLTGTWTSSRRLFRSGRNALTASQGKHRKRRQEAAQATQPECDKSLLHLPII
jgi:hypothetical protein